MILEEDFDSFEIDTRQVPLLLEWLLDLYTAKEGTERSILIHGMIKYWGRFEMWELEHPDATPRQAFLGAQEIIIDEERKVYRDLDARRHFTKDDDPIDETRRRFEETMGTHTAPEVDEETRVQHSAGALMSMNSAENDWIAVG